MQDLISIIIPLHNAAPYIEETIHSCLQQTYNHIEVIVVENGSSDNSWEMVKNIQDQKIKAFKIPAGNASIARNYGYKQSKGKYIMFLDADDLLSKNKIESQVKILRSKEEGYISSCAWAKFKEQPINTSVKFQSVWKVTSPIKWCLNSWMGEGMMALHGWLIPKNIIKKAGLWDESLTLHDDGEFMCRVLLASKGNLFSEECTVYYRQTEDSLSKNNTSEKAALSALKVYQSYEQNILHHKDSPEIRHALAMNYSRFLYEYYHLFPDLCKTAKAHIKYLGIKKIPVIGGGNFKRIAGIVGLENALKIKRWLT